MIIPTDNFKIKVGPFIYDVIYSIDVANEGSIFGSTHNNEQKIFIDPGKPKQKQEQTFIHEVFHACCFISGLTYRLADKQGSCLEEEDICRELSTVFYQVIKDNPSIFPNIIVP